MSPMNLVQRRRKWGPTVDFLFGMSSSPCMAWQWFRGREMAWRQDLVFEFGHVALTSLKLRLGGKRRRAGPKCSLRSL
jgi:hypothetical protein